MALEQGDVVKIYIDNTSGTALALPGQTTCSWDISTDVAEKTAKGDTFKLIEATKSQHTIEFQGYYDQASSTAITRVLTLVLAGAPTVSGEMQRSGVQYKSFSGVLTSFTIDHSDGEFATYSGTVVVSGALT